MSYTISLNIEGIGTIAVDAFSFGIQGEATTGAGGGSSTVSDLTITKRLDTSSLKLFQAAVTGKHFVKATLSLTKAGSTTPDAVYLLTEIVISSFAESGNGHDGIFPVEVIALAFSKLSFQVVS